METTKGARAHESASPDEPNDWHLIDWGLVELFVGRLQTRIAQAEQAKDFRRVKRLQRSLVRSWQAKALAVRRVTTNRGKRTAGTDRELWKTPEAKWKAVCRLNQPGYRARPLKRVYIPKSNGRERPLGIPTMFDRAMQALYLSALEPAAECAADPHSYGFRRVRSAHDAAGHLFTCLSKEASAPWVLDADITGFFDNINHEWLLRRVHMNKRVLQQWLKAGYLDKGHLHRTEMGTPQGGIISPTLANLTLNGLETGLDRHLKAVLGSMKARSAKVHLVRYADDFVVTGASQEVLTTVVRPWIEGFLRERGLRLSEEKTQLVHIKDGFDFLGWNFRKYKARASQKRTKWKLLITPSRKNVKAFYGKVSEIIKSSLAVRTERLITRLNPVLRGWALYHRSMSSKRTLARMDHLIYWRLFRWGRRRHSRKSGKWVYEKYWKVCGTRKTFSTTARRRDGEPFTLELFRLADMPIKRHKKIKSDYNPFDPSWEAYGEERFVAQRSIEITSRERRPLWDQQGGRCPLCGTLLDSAQAADDHHIVFRMHGGSNALSNRVLLHPACHRRVHALGLEVTKPVPVRGT